MLCMPLNVPSMCLTNTHDQRFTDLTVIILVTNLYVSFLMAVYVSCVTESLHSSAHSTICPIQFSISWTCVMAYSKLKLKSRQKSAFLYQITCRSPFMWFLFGTISL